MLTGCRTTTLGGKTVGGLAIKLRAVLDMKELDDVRLEDLKNPCTACRQGLWQCGINWEGGFLKSLV